MSEAFSPPLDTFVSLSRNIFLDLPISPIFGEATVTDRIQSLIYIIREERVMLDQDLAALYDVETKALVQAVQRNIGRFPPDFMFQLSFQEFTALRSQIVTSKGRGGRRTAPYAFTEHGVAMLSSVLRSERAVEINIEIIRAFVKLRQLVASNAELTGRLNRLEQKYDSQFKVVFDAIRQLMSEATPVPPKRRIGF
ncbi:MAG: hypothetical protein RL518_2296 [Pseudomonadota bacterium]|jgi:hypothetical protein